MTAPDLTQTFVAEHCSKCSGTGQHMAMTESAPTELFVVRCRECSGTGRRRRWAYEPGRGEQSEELEPKKPEGKTK